MSRSPILAVLIALLLALPLATAARADDPVKLTVSQVDVGEFPNVRAVVSVTDAQGTPVKGLQAADLLASEDGRQQRIGVELANLVAPVALVLVLDTSGSMGGKPLADAKAAMSSLIGSLGPNDQAAIVTFNTAVTVDQPMTSDKTALVAATNRAVAAGNTAIFDAVSRATELFGGLPPQTRKAIVLLTDGVDNSSTIPLANATAKLTALDAPLYVVGLGTDLDRPVLQALADASKGGAAYVAPTSAQLLGIYNALSQQLATQYSVSYRSSVPEVAAGATMTLTLQIVRAGAALGSTTVTFNVPAGHGVTRPSAPTVEPAPVRDAPALPILRPTPYDAVIVGLLGAASALCLLLWAFVLSAARSLAGRERRRVGELAGSFEQIPGRPALRSFRERVLLPFLQRLARPFLRFMPSSDGTRQRLAQAGDPFNLGPAEFVGIRVASAFLGATAALAVAAIVNIDLLLFLLAALLGLFLGYALPGIVLGRAIASRQHKIHRALPAALDMLALAATAGLTFDGAVAQVVERWDTPFSDELRRLLLEFRMGSERRVALRAVAKRTGLQDVSRFVNAVIQADSLGVPVSRVLIEQAVEMRTRRRQRAEEAARKAPVKMLFPMVGLVFPALFVVILGPAVPRLLNMFGSF
jgi:tight adherence protein C